MPFSFTNGTKIIFFPHFNSLNHPLFILYLYSYFIIKSNQWNHIVITKTDGNGEDKKVSMYTGGSLRDNASGVTTLWNKIKIGLNRGDHNHWDGYIDEVKIYNRTLSTQEVLDLYECY